MPKWSNFGQRQYVQHDLAQVGEQCFPVADQLGLASPELLPHSVVHLGVGDDGGQLGPRDNVLNGRIGGRLRDVRTRESVEVAPGQPRPSGSFTRYAAMPRAVHATERKWFGLLHNEAKPQAIDLRVR